jgi:hypothetical protein
MKNVCIFYDHLEKFVVVWYSLWSFGIFLPFWYVWTKKNLASQMYTLDPRMSDLAEGLAFLSLLLFGSFFEHCLSFFMKAR